MGTAGILASQIATKETRTVTPKITESKINPGKPMMATTSRLTMRRPQGWFKSSYSNASGSCVEVRITTGPTLVRDSKDRRMNTPVIQFGRGAWASFLRVLATKTA